MNKTVVAAVGALTIAILGLLIWGKSNQAAPPTEEQLGQPSSFVAEEKFYDFGTISMAAGKVTHKFEIKNASTTDVMLERLSTSCMCTASFIEGGASRKGPFGMPGHGYVPKANELVKAGETRVIEAVFDPAAHGPAGVGPIDRFVYVQEKGGPILKLEFKAVVTP